MRANAMRTGLDLAGVGLAELQHRDLLAVDRHEDPR
jgi:hypothetical protein